MKRNIIFLALLFFTMHLANAQESRLLGNWGILEAPEPLSIIEFKSDNTGILNIEGQVFEIKEYRVEPNTNPIIVGLTTEFNGQDATMYALIEFTDDNTLQIELFSPGSDKPVAFSESDENKFVLSKL